MKRVYIFDKSLNDLVEVEYVQPEPKVHIINDKVAGGNYIRCHSIGLEEKTNPFFESKSKYKREVHARGARIVGNDFNNVNIKDYRKKHMKKVDVVDGVRQVLADRRK